MLKLAPNIFEQAATQAIEVGPRLKHVIDPPSATGH